MDGARTVHATFGTRSEASHETLANFGNEEYLDYNSTAPIADGVLHAVRPFLSNEFGNPSSKTNRLGQRAREAIETARGHVANLVGSRADQVVFTSGGTESCFAALVGAFRAQKNKRHLVISAVEHPAVTEAAEFLRTMCGVEVTQVSVNRNGRLNIDELFEAIRPQTGVLSFMLANNETGVLFPVPEIVEMAHARGLLVHTDAVQAIGKIPVSFAELGVDLLSLSAHKFGGVKGSGALVIRDNALWEPVVKGGGQEGGRRGGTEAVALIVAQGEAAKNRKQQLDAGMAEGVRSVRDFFEAALAERIPEVMINGAAMNRLPNTSSVQFEGVVAQELVQALAERGIIVSAGSACKAGSAEPSTVLRSMGLSVVQCLSTLRFSFGPHASRESVLHTIDILCETVAYFRAEMREQLQANFR
ncbi:MAG: cysteine desulfurase family protein [Bdellovibrionota bacterium]